MKPTRWIALTLALASCADTPDERATPHGLAIDTRSFDPRDAGRAR